MGKSMAEQYPKDTNGEWQRVKGTDTVHRGDYVPLEGIKGTGSANIYFDGYAKNKHVEKEAKGKAKIFANIGCALILLCIVSMIVSVQGWVPRIIGIPCALLFGCLGALFFGIGFKMS